MKQWLVAIAMSLASATSMPSPDARSASAGDYVVTADPDDIVVRGRDGKTVFSAHAFADAQQAALKQVRGADLETVRHRFSVVSLAGPFLALRDQVEINSGSAIPGGSTRYWTIDLRQPARYVFDDEEPLRPLPNDKTLVDLRQFFSADVLAAAVGSTSLAAPLKASPPRRDLRYVLSDLSKRGMESPNCYGADNDVTSSFAVVGKSAGRLRVQLGMPGQSYCRYALTALDIDLPNSGMLAAAIGPGRVSISRPGTTIIDTPEQAKP